MRNPIRQQCCWCIMGHKPLQYRSWFSLVILTSTAFAKQSYSQSSLGFSCLCVPCLYYTLPINFHQVRTAHPLSSSHYTLNSHCLIFSSFPQLLCCLSVSHLLCLSTTSLHFLPPDFRDVEFYKIFSLITQTHKIKAPTIHTYDKCHPDTLKQLLS